MSFGKWQRLNLRSVKVSLLPLLSPEAPCYDLNFQRQIQGCPVVTSQPLQAPLFSPSRLMSSADSCPKPQSWAQGADKDGHGEREAVHDTSSNIREHKLQYIKKKTEVGIFVTYHTNQTTLVHETHRTIYQESSKHAVAIVLLKKRKEKKGVQSALSRNFCKQCFFFSLLYHRLK